MSQQVVTANRLVDGVVVYLDADGSWTDQIGRSQVATGKDDGHALMAIADKAERDRVVVAPYLIDVAAENGTVRPLRYREVIRAGGPSIAYAPGNDAAEG